MCFLTQSVRLTLSSVCSWLCWSVLCKVAKCLEIVEKMNRLALLNFKIFWGQCPQTPILGRGYGAPPQTPTPSALRWFAPLCLARGLRPLHRPSLCVVDILRYFRPCSNYGHIFNRLWDIRRQSIAWLWKLGLGFQGNWNWRLSIDHIWLSIDQLL